MSHDLYLYGDQNAIVFVLSDTSGIGVTGKTLLAADVQLSTWDDSSSTWTNSINIGADCVEGDNGFYYWVPSTPLHTQHSIISLFINDSSGGAAFVENRLIIASGGNANARFSG